MVKEVRPELILVVPAHPNIPKDAVIQSSARGIQCPAVVFVVRIIWIVQIKVDAAITRQELRIGMEPAVVAHRIDYPARGGVLA